jgi:hypothetical protein
VAPPLSSAPTPVNCNHRFHPAQPNLSLGGQQRATGATSPSPLVEVAAAPAPCSVALVTAGALSELNSAETRPGTKHQVAEVSITAVVGQRLASSLPVPVSPAVLCGDVSQSLCGHASGVTSGG